MKPAPLNDDSVRLKADQTYATVQLKPRLKPDTTHKGRLVRGTSYEVGCGMPSRSSHEPASLANVQPDPEEKCTTR